MNNRQRRPFPLLAALLVCVAFCADHAWAQATSAVDLGTLVAGYHQTARLRPGERADDKLALDDGYAAELTIQIVSGNGLAVSGLDKNGKVRIVGGAGTLLRRTLIADAIDRRWQISITSDPPDSSVEFVLGITRGRPATAADRDRLAAEESLTQAEAQGHVGADRNKTVALFDSAIQGWRKSGDGCGLRGALMAKARYMMQAQDFATTAQLAIDASAQSCDRDVSGHAAAQHLLASASLARGDTNTAIAADERAIAEYHQLGDVSAQLGVLRDLADAYRRSGNTAKALDQLQAARALAGNDAASLAALDVQTGNLHLQREALAPARDDFQRALDELHGTPSPALEGQAWLGLAKVAQLQGDASAESASQGQAESACTRSGDQACLQTLALARADGLLRQGQAMAADPLYQQVLGSTASTPAMQARAKAGRGYAAMAQQRWDDARAQLEAAAKAYRGLKDAAGEAPVQLALGDVLTQAPNRPAHSGYDRRGFYHYRFVEKDKPLPVYAEALRLARQAGNDGLTALALADLARAERDEGRWADARRDIDAAINFIEAGVLPPDDALHRSLKLPDLVSIYDLQSAIEAQGGDTPVTTMAAQALIEAERQRAADATVTLPTVSDLKRLADPQWALLEYRLGDPASDAWLVTPAGVQAFRLPARGVIEPVAVHLSQALAAAARAPGGPDRNPADIATAAGQLEQALLQPLEKAIGTRNLAIVADGALTDVPFALLDRSGKASPSGNPRQLVRLPSIASLVSLRNRPPTHAEGIAVVGDPVLRANDSRLGSDRAASPIASAADSAAAVISELGDSKTEKLLGFDASRAGLRQQDWHGIGTLHIATPTVLNLGHPDHSGIVLSLYEVGGHAQNGFLRASDIAAMHLPVDTVVLADTAVAAEDGAANQDPYALTESFMKAGARRVVSGLWRLEPQAASLFMQHFYDGLANRQLPVPAALSAAQRMLQQDPRWNSPAIWAAYEVEGDWR